MKDRKRFIDIKFDTSILQQHSTQQQVSDLKKSIINIKWALTSNIIGIFGDSGAGKTTLLKRLAGVNSNVAANFKVNDTHVNLHRSGKNPCVYVGADAPLFEHLSLLENLRLTQSHSQWSDSATANTLCCAIDIDNVPHLSIEQVVKLCEVEHLLAQPSVILSGGEKQRGQLARALLSGKPILLLDEAFSAMDWGLRSRLHQRLIKLAKNNARAIVMVSHSLRELAIMSDHLVHIQNGIVSSEGSTFEQLDTLQQSQDILFSALRVRHLEDDHEYELSVFVLEGVENSAKLYAKMSAYANSTQRLLVDANTVVLSKQREPNSSMLNQLEARIESIIETSTLAVVCLDINGQCLYSHISKKSRFDMQLFAGDTIYAMFKAI